MKKLIILTISILASISSFAKTAEACKQELGQTRSILNKNQTREIKTTIRTNLSVQEKVSKINTTLEKVECVVLILTSQDRTVLDVSTGLVANLHALGAKYQTHVYIDGMVGYILSEN